MSDQNNQSQQQQPTPTQTTSQATQQNIPAQPPLEFINIETSRSVEMFKGSTGLGDIRYEIPREKKSE
jgi:hypothetical protein